MSGQMLLCRLVMAKSVGATMGRASQTANFAQFCCGSSNNGLMVDNQATNKSASQYIGKPACQQNIFSMNGVRNIYTERSLRLETLDLLRQDKGRIFDSGKERYIERVKKYIESGETQSVVKEDLINIIGLADSEQHLDLIEQMISQPSLKDSLAGGPWGSVLMRLYYRLNQIDRACKNIKDTEKFGDFFLQYAAFRVVLTQLFKAGRYEEVLEIYNIACEKLSLGNQSRQRQLDIVALAACVKINTLESFDTAEKIFTKSLGLENCNHLRSRLESLFVYLAIHMNEAAKGLNCLTGTKMKNNLYLPTTSLKVLALIKLNRYEDVVFNLREAIQLVSAGYKVLPQEIVDTVQAKKDEIEDENVRQELMDLLVELKDNNLLDERSLESIIFNDIETREGNQPQFSQQRQPQQQQRYQQDSHRESRPFNYSRDRQQQYHHQRQDQHQQQYQQPQQQRSRRQHRQFDQPEDADERFYK